MNKDYELLKSNVVECKSGCFDEVKEPIIIVKELRKRLIKEIKELSKSNNTDHSTCYPENLCSWCAIQSHQVDWIMDFFNITQEELIGDE